MASKVVIVAAAILLHLGLSSVWLRPVCGKDEETTAIWRRELKGFKLSSQILDAFAQFAELGINAITSDDHYKDDSWMNGYLDAELTNAYVTFLKQADECPCCLYTDSYTGQKACSTSCPLSVQPVATHCVDVFVDYAHLRGFCGSKCAVGSRKYASQSSHSTVVIPTSIWIDIALSMLYWMYCW